MSGLAKTHVKSAWTPLNNAKANQKVGHEIVMVREIFDSCQDMFSVKVDPYLQNMDLSVE